MPDGGGIVIIDDKEDDGRPLLRALVRGGHMATLLTPDPKDLPEKPLGGVRIVFLDLVFSNWPPDKTAADAVETVMRSVVDPKKNGPFVLIFWTNNGGEAEGAKKVLKESGFRFVPAMMEKDDYREGGEFNLEKIRAGMRRSVKVASTLQLFMLWENSVRRAGEGVVRRLSDLHAAGAECGEAEARNPDGGDANPIDREWDDKMLEAIDGLARAVGGGRTASREPARVAEKALYALNAALGDSTHRETRGALRNGAPDLRAPRAAGGGRANPGDRDGKINSWLLTRDADDEPAPGSVYPNGEPRGGGSAAPIRRVEVDDLLRRETPGKEDLRSRARHVVLEVTPACDHAEEKMRAHRLLPGAMLPGSLLKRKHIKSAEYAYTSPVMFLEGDLYYMVFDFRRFTSVDIGDPRLRDPAFALQSELLADIQSKLSNHVSRTGVVSLRP